MKAIFKLQFWSGLIFCVLIATSSSAMEVELVSYSAQGLTLSMNLPDFRYSEKQADDAIFRTITIEGWGTIQSAGSPQLPLRGIMLGIPSQGTVKAEVVRENSEEFPRLEIYPCPKKTVEEKDGEVYLKEVYYRDREVYSRDSYFPGKLVEVSQTGYMRGQRVAKVNIYPFQYNPVRKKLRVYRKMLIRVSFDGGEIEPLPFAREELPYEEMLQNLLLNYGSLGRYEVKGVEKERSVSERAGDGSVPNLKIHLNAEGIYKIGYADLSSFWNMGAVDPKKIHLKHLGEEIPILFKGNEDDGQFNQSDYLLFYAPPLEGYYADYTKNDVYWLSVEPTDGLRMSSVDGTLRGGQLLTSFTNLYHGEEDKEYWQTIPNGEGKDHFFWVKLVITKPFTPVSADITFSLSNILSTPDNCSITFSFRGKTDTAADLDHHTQIVINGNLISDDWWNGQIEFETTATFPQSYLQDGTNTLTVKSLGDTGASVDTIYFNWFDLIYKDTYVAEDNTLKFNGSGSGDCEINVSGFTSSDINLFDITDPVNPKKVINTSITAGNILKFTDTISGMKEYMAVTTGSAKAPISIEADVSSSLKSSLNGADYIIITHEAFYNAVQPLAVYRASQGLRVMTVMIQDVYDEFSYGMFDPSAIKGFLTYAYENYQKPAPLYCLIVGDANIDYKDNLSTGRKNYVPTHIFQTKELGDTPGDNWFACVSGNDMLPDMFIGRISIQTAADLTNVVNKILDYEQAEIQAWNQQTLFVADNDGASFEPPRESPFETVNNTLINYYLPGTYQSNKVYLSQYDINKNLKIEESEKQAAKNALKSYINTGQLLIVYIGHGSVDNWTAEYLFTSDDVTSLTNSKKPAFVITLNCLNGFFASPVDDYCLGEEFVRAQDKGAMACFAPTGLGYTWEHSYLAQELYNYLTASSSTCISQGHLRHSFLRDEMLERAL